MGLITFRKKDRVALDTNIFICALKESDHRYQRASFILQQLKDKRLKVSISILVIEEFFIKVYKEGREKQKDEILDFINLDGQVNIVDVNQQVALKAAQIRAKYSSLRTPDAIHLASAIEAEAQIFITTDKRIPSKIENLVIKILK